MDIIRKISMVFITIMVSVFSMLVVDSKTLERSGEYRYSPTYSDVYYDSLTSNTAITQREAINSVLYNLGQEGFELQSLVDDGLYVDVILSNDSSTWRYVFDLSNNYLMFFNNRYETSYTGETYIIDERK